MIEVTPVLKTFDGDYLREPTFEIRNLGELPKRLTITAYELLDVPELKESNAEFEFSEIVTVMRLRTFVRGGFSFTGEYGLKAQYNEVAEGKNESND